MSFVHVYWKMFCFKETFHLSQMHSVRETLCVDPCLLVMWHASDTGTSCVSRCQTRAVNRVRWLWATLCHSSLVLDGVFSEIHRFKKSETDEGLGTSYLKHRRAVLFWVELVSRLGKIPLKFSVFSSSNSVCMIDLSSILPQIKIDQSVILFSNCKQTNKQSLSYKNSTYCHLPCQHSPI